LRIKIAFLIFLVPNSKIPKGLLEFWFQEGFLGSTKSWKKFEKKMRVSIPWTTEYRKGFPKGNGVVKQFIEKN